MARAGLADRALSLPLQRAGAQGLEAVALVVADQKTEPAQPEALEALVASTAAGAEAGEVQLLPEMAETARLGRSSLNMNRSTLR
jgi:hypothetical protein